MKRLTVVVLLLCCLSAQMFASQTASGVQGYEPYTEEEFPQWSRELRRAETIFFGSLPITLTFASIGYAAGVALGAPQFLNETVALFSIAAGVSLIIAITDYVLGVTGK
ncbi:MAG: hypothetical protein WCY44_01920 [Sphaerochaetaceae bacterium]